MSANRVQFTKKSDKNYTNAWSKDNMCRNLPCIPSDDESKHDDTSAYSSSEDGSISKTKNQDARSKPIISKIKLPLPSDKDTDDGGDNRLSAIKYNKTVKNPLHGSLPYRVNRSAPSLSQQLENPKKQQHRHSHNSTSKAKDRSISTENLHKFMQKEDGDDAIIGQYLRPTSSGASKSPAYSQKHQNQNKQLHTAVQYNKMPMSGMDLLMQREQQKAESKRQKPKIDSKNAKIEGLLGNLPEPGIHNINFQHVEYIQQQQQQQYPTSPVPNNTNNKRHRSKQLNQTSYLQQQQQQQQQQQLQSQLQQQQQYAYAVSMYQQAYLSPMMYNQQQPFYPMMPYNNMYMLSHNNQQHLPMNSNNIPLTQLNNKPQSAKSVSFSSQQVL